MQDIILCRILRSHRSNDIGVFGMHWQILGSRVPTYRNRLARILGRLCFSLMGWRIEGQFPDRSKLVVALTPHSSNVDFVLTLAVLWGLGLRSAFLMKHTLFWFPLGGLLSALGGIPVDRRNPQGLVEGLTILFQSSDGLVLGITPEGTRKGVKRWKDGFARVAIAANVPVLPTILDYRKRTVTFGALIEGVTDVHALVDRVRVLSASGSPRRLPDRLG